MAKGGAMIGKPPMVPSAKERVDAVYETWNSPGSEPDIEILHEMAMQQAYDDGFAAGLTRLNREIASEYEARCKCREALRRKDTAMGVLFERLRAAGIDYSDLIS
jgi:hypothetical protein